MSSAVSEYPQKVKNPYFLFGTSCKGLYLRKKSDNHGFAECLIKTSTSLVPQTVSDVTAFISHNFNKSYSAENHGSTLKNFSLQLKRGDTKFLN